MFLLAKWKLLNISLIIWLYMICHIKKIKTYSNFSLTLPNDQIFFTKSAYKYLMFMLVTWNFFHSVVESVQINTIINN